jgi:gluconate 2-dehydrogenase alpha chain
MATRLKDTDVVIIGLGAAGGVAALPLAQAGLDVIGLEAGTWLTKRDFAPDELRNLSRLAASRAEGQSVPTHRPTAVASSPRPALRDDERRGRDGYYWAQSWRLNPWTSR